MQEIAAGSATETMTAADLARRLDEEERIADMKAVALKNAKAEALKKTKAAALQKAKAHALKKEEANRRAAKMKAKNKKAIVWTIIKNRDGFFTDTLKDVLVLDGDCDLVAYEYREYNNDYGLADPTPLPNQLNTKALYQANEANQAVELKKEEKKDRVIY